LKVIGIKFFYVNYFAYIYYVMNEQIKTNMKVQVPTQMMNDAIFIAKDRNGKKFPFKGMAGEHPEASAQAWGPATLIGFEFLPIDINNYKGGVPAGCSLVVQTPEGEEYELMGFDEVGMFGEAIYGFAPSYGNGDLNRFEFVQDNKAFNEYMQGFKLPEGPIPVK
jgi:hypothetical protein